MGFTLEAACCSNIGKRRCNNEDNFFFDNICMEEENRGTRNPLFMEQALKQNVCVAVFDGMGGENYGEQASFAAARAIQASVKATKEFYVSERKYLQRMADRMNLAVNDRAKELVTNRMGTTVAALYFSSRNVYCMNVGDSRIYRLRDRVLSQLSEDHVSSRPMPEGKKAPLIQYLGMDPQEIQLSPYIAKGELRAGDRYLICSDGLTDMVCNASIMDILLNNPDPVDAVSALVNTALEHGGHDNVTVIVCNIR